MCVCEGRLLCGGMCVSVQVDCYVEECVSVKVDCYVEECVSVKVDCYLRECRGNVQCGGNVQGEGGRSENSL